MDNQEQPQKQQESKFMQKTRSSLVFFIDYFVTSFIMFIIAYIIILIVKSAFKISSNIIIFALLFVFMFAINLLTPIRKIKVGEKLVSKYDRQLNKLTNR